MSFLQTLSVLVRGPLSVGAVALLATTGFSQDSKSTKVRVEPVKDPAGWNVFVGEDLFAGYRSDVAGTPVIYPLHLANDVALTRNFPMKEASVTEKPDHDHHRSMWLTHGDVNGTDFWLDGEKAGKIVQTGGEAEASEDGKSGVIVTSNDWIDTKGEKVLSDTRRYEFFVDKDRRIIDCDFLLKASYGDVNFGDTKEGTFGVRVAGTMKVDAKKGGLITNAEGLNNKAAWGKKSTWVDYSGPVGENTAGVTIHAHPSGFGYPCRWHVRTYGLFAANPFGVYHFDGGDKTNGIVLKKGTKMRLNYRVVLHPGELAMDQTKADSEKYENDPRPPLE